MTEVSIPDAHGRLSAVVDEARLRREPVYLTRDGRRVAAVIGIDEFERLVDAAEDLADLTAAKAARAESARHGTVSWAQVKSDLGLT